MLSRFTLHQPNRARRLWLSLAALAVGGFLSVPLYLTWATGVILQSLNAGIPAAPGIFLLLLYGVPQILLFTHPVRALLVTLLSIGLVVAALLWGRPGRVIRILLSLILLAILASPLFARYQPAVVAAPGHEMHVPTQPNLLAGVVKRAQAFAEIRLCDYTLLGWSVEGVLYYEEACKDQAPQIWAYNPDRDSRPRQVGATPADLMQTPIPRSSVLEWVQSPSVYPAEAEPGVRHLKVRQNGVASPDGRWVAVVTRHIYGPEDVIVLSPPDEETP